MARKAQILGSAAVIVLGGAAPAGAHGITERVSVGPGGAQSNAPSHNPAVSAGGRFVAFSSAASNLVWGDTNDVSDVFIRDRRTGATERVSVGPGGLQGDGGSFESSISADGRFVAFISTAANLVPGDTNGVADVFVRDRRTGTIERVSVGRGGVQGDLGSERPSITPDGRFVAFTSLATNLVPADTNRTFDVFVHDRQKGVTQRVSLGQGNMQGNSVSADPSVSADGRFVAFVSFASNLVPGDTNGWGDVFVRDRRTGTTRRVSVGRGGVQGDFGSERPSITPDGRFVAFTSFATNLVPGDTNRYADVFVRDRRSGTTKRVSVGPNGVQSDADSFGSPISSDGRFVAFVSRAYNLVRGDTNGADDAFVRDRWTSTTRRASLGQGGVQGDGFSFQAAISADGRFVAFTSGATNLVPGDTNESDDVFVRIQAP